jgi:hypothetical protein
MKAEFFSVALIDMSPTDIAVLMNRSIAEVLTRISTTQICNKGRG